MNHMSHEQLQRSIAELENEIADMQRTSIHGAPSARYDGDAMHSTPRHDPDVAHAASASTTDPIAQLAAAIAGSTCHTHAYKPSRTTNIPRRQGQQRLVGVYRML